ncbi:MAG TPA: FAD-binding oxidoreductase [Cerasibacillus sp.]|uniref:NAD(P)/FAD-dependent oxidoreductase n=1 Tax=Cerasibacillus sp. TaxID=2498711 RepID=UPI002F42BB22
MKKKIIIIGAGILGASTAYQLSKTNTDVILIDRNEPGQATDAATGIICPWLSKRRNQAWYHLAKNGAKIYPTIINELEKDGEKETGYKQVGALSVRAKKETLLEMKEIALKRRVNAPEIGEVTILNPKETRKLFPPIAEGLGAVHVSGAARVDGGKLRKALINGALKNGVKYIQDSASLILEGQTVTGVKLSESTIKADTVIATNGAWMKELLAPIGITFSSSPQKGQLIQLHMPDVDTSEWPVIMPPSNQSIVPFDDRVIIGATHEKKEVGFDHRITAEGMHRVLFTALKFAPGLGNGTIIGTRVGFRPYTPEYLPVIGKIPPYEGLIAANGLGASGLTTGPYLGTQLAKLALDQPLDIDLQHYDIHEALMND